MGSNIVYPVKSTTTSEFSRTESLLSVKDLKERFLHGINLVNRDGITFPDTALQFYIDAAITMLEDDMEIYVNPVSLEEDRDYVINDYINWSFIELDNNPVISLDKFEIRFLKNEAYVEFPAEWIRLDSATGVIRVAATMGTIQSWIVTSFSFLPRLVARTYDFPHFFHLEYTAGFEQDKVPKSVNMAIGLISSIYILSVLGNLILAPGISSESISLDGLSQSTSKEGGGKGPFGSTIDMYKEMLWGNKNSGIPGIINNLRKMYSRNIGIDVV